MCGRYTFFSPAESVTRLFDTPVPVPVEARYNIAPTQFVPAIRQSAESGRRIDLLHWGLVPSWAKDKAIGNRMINARAETLAEKPSFKRALRARRCLILTSGYYEWRKEGERKQPYFISRRDGDPMAMAGLWEHWDGQQGGLDSCTIVTTDANEFLQPLHHRMPAIIPPDRCAQWLGVEDVNAGDARGMLQPLEGDHLQAWAVSTRVNNARNEGHELIEPLQAPDQGATP
jgi:putative SOS response-associated peptidase YedK